MAMSLAPARGVGPQLRHQGAEPLRGSLPLQRQPHGGKGYTAILGLQSGDEFEIKLGRKQIRLVPVGGADEE
jgi:hypothetical protein